MGVEATVEESVTAQSRPAPTTVRPGLGQLAYDIITLAELQTKLVRLDFARCTRRIAIGSACLAIAAVVAVGGVTVLVAGFGYGLVEWLQWPLSVSMATAGVFAAVVSGMIVAMAAAILRPLSSAFHHSGEELKRNVETMKNSLLKG